MRARGRAPRHRDSPAIVTQSRPLASEKLPPPCRQAPPPATRPPGAPTHRLHRQAPSSASRPLGAPASRRQRTASTARHRRHSPLSPTTGHQPERCRPADAPPPTARPRLPPHAPWERRRPAGKRAARPVNAPPSPPGTTPTTRSHWPLAAGHQPKPHQQPSSRGRTPWRSSSAAIFGRAWMRATRAATWRWRASRAAWSSGI